MQLDVSIIIVCMNNLKMLFPCLESIITYTHKVKYEIIVIAYLFSKDNLVLLKGKYPFIKIIESNEIRGFSENNNLALINVDSTFCLILNDDTYFDTPLIDLLVESFNTEPSADFFSPVIYDAQGKSCGRPPEDLFSFLISQLFRIKYIRRKNKIFVDQQGNFQTYNVAGCCFMVKTKILKELDYFNENYFFCPEDIELSTKANKQGKKCFVNSSLIIYHRQGSTSSLTSIATFPAMYKGYQLFYSNLFRLPKAITTIILVVGLTKYWIYWSLQSTVNSSINKKKYSNAIRSLFIKKSPKEIFIKYFQSISK